MAIKLTKLEQKLISLNMKLMIRNKIYSNDISGKYETVNIKGYPFIANSNTEKFATALAISLSLIDKKSLGDILFCDLGCGKGNIIFPLASMGMRVLGIEYDKNYLNIVKDSFIPLTCPHKLIHADIRDVDYSNYDVDIFYAYCPMQDSKQMQSILNNIKAQMKPGSVFIYFSANSAKLDITKKSLYYTDGEVEIYQKPFEESPCVSEKIAP